MAYQYGHAAASVGGLVAGSIATGSALVGLAVFGPEAMEAVTEELTNSAKDLTAGSTTNDGFMDTVLNKDAAETAAEWAQSSQSFLASAQSYAGQFGAMVAQGFGALVQTVGNWAGAGMTENPLQGAVDWLNEGAAVNEMATAPGVDSAAFWQEKAAAYVGAGAAHGAYKKINGESWVASVTAATPGVNLVR